VLVSNHPQLAGGSHLPDITVITPVFVECHKHPQFFVASRCVLARYVTLAFSINGLFARIKHVYVQCRSVAGACKSASLCS
jgi:Hydantoinase B/oxoprolinase